MVLPVAYSRSNTFSCLHTVCTLYLPVDLDKPGHFCTATDPVAVNGHCNPHTLSVSNLQPTPVQLHNTKAVINNHFCSPCCIEHGT